MRSPLAVECVEGGWGLTDLSVLVSFLLSSNLENFVQELLLARICWAFRVKSRQSFVGALLQLFDIELELLDIRVLFLIGLNDKTQNVVEQMHTLYIFS